MTTRSSASRDETLLVIKGPLSGSAVDAFQARMEEAVRVGSFTITLDLSEVPAINSAVLGKLLMFRMRLAETGRTLRIRGCDDGIYRMFRMLRIDTLIPVTK
jgi:anti-anti-sigma factor